MAQFSRAPDGWIGKNTGLDAVSLQRRHDGFDAADLDDGDVLLGDKPEVTQPDTRAGVDGGAVAADAQRLALQLLRFFNLRANH